MPKRSKSKAPLPMDAEAASLEQDIRKAFRKVRRGRITLHQAEVIDEYGSEGEEQEARQKDTEKSWEQIPDQHISSCTTALCYFDPISWRYYIPAYMTWALRRFRVDWSMSSDATIYQFAHGGAYQQERFDVLDDAQRQVICRFLKYMAGQPGLADAEVAQRALDAYWGQFCA